LLKTTAPGVPDFYQGTELWAFTLVDPDNRRPVDYERRRALLASLREVGEGDVSEFVEGLLERPWDGRLKLFVTARALNFRRERAELFARGEYLALRAKGRRATGVVSFARSLEGDAVIVVASRFFTRLGVGREGTLSLKPEAWGDTTLQLEGVEGGRFRDVFTGREFEARDGALDVASILSPLPVALLSRV
jgi:(1->4)-alpha-D-glucan 1-alpha-D-glucosylmutase